MRSRLFRRSPWTVAVGLVLATTAWAAPWDSDLVDSETIKPFERVMAPTPEGTVPQANMLTPRGVSMADHHDTSLTSPMAVTTATIAQGEVLYGTYCSMCHGQGMELGTVMQAARWPAEKRAGIPAEGILMGYPPGWIYVKARYGKAGPDSRIQYMPSYGWALSDAETWSIVHYLRRTVAPATDQ